MIQSRDWKRFPRWDRLLWEREHWWPFALDLNEHVALHVVDVSAGAMHVDIHGRRFRLNVAERSLDVHTTCEANDLTLQIYRRGCAPFSSVVELDKQLVASEGDEETFEALPEELRSDLAGGIVKHGIAGFELCAGDLDIMRWMTADGRSTDRPRSLEDPLAQLGGALDWLGQLLPRLDTLEVTRENTFTIG